MNNDDSTLIKHLDTMKALMSGNDPRCERHIFLEPLFLFLLCLVQMVTPGFWVRHFGGIKSRQSRKAWVERYALAKVVIASSILFFCWWRYTFFQILSWLLLADIFISLAGYIFLRKFWQNPYSWNRSLILLFLNFLEYTFWFACLFLSYDCLASSCTSEIKASDAIYFSIVTAATVGYGDIAAKPGMGRSLVTLEICASLFFMAMVVAYFVSNITTEEKDKETTYDTAEGKQRISTQPKPSLPEH